MSKPKVSASFAVVESSENLINTLDAHKTTNAFPVISTPQRPGESGDFMGIISRSRWVYGRDPALLLKRSMYIGVRKTSLLEQQQHCRVQQLSQNPP